MRALFPVLNGKGAGEKAYSTLCIRVMGPVAIPLRSMRFKTLNGNATVMGRRVAYHEAHDLFVSSLDDINKNL